MRSIRTSRVKGIEMCVICNLKTDLREFIFFKKRIKIKRTTPPHSLQNKKANSVSLLSTLHPVVLLLIFYTILRPTDQHQNSLSHPAYSLILSTSNKISPAQIIFPTKYIKITTQKEVRRFPLSLALHLLKSFLHFLGSRTAHLKTLPDTKQQSWRRWNCVIFAFCSFHVTPYFQNQVVLACLSLVLFAIKRDC